MERSAHARAAAVAHVRVLVPLGNQALAAVASLRLALSAARAAHRAAARVAIVVVVVIVVCASERIKLVRYGAVLVGVADRPLPRDN